jgi:hypothetical protein
MLKNYGSSVGVIIRDLPLKSRLLDSYNLDFIPKAQKQRRKAIFLKDFIFN